MTNLKQGMWIKVYLKNKFYFEGKVLESDEEFLTIVDRYDEGSRGIAWSEISNWHEVKE